MNTNGTSPSSVLPATQTRVEQASQTSSANTDLGYIKFGEMFQEQQAIQDSLAAKGRKAAERAAATPTVTAPAQAENAGIPVLPTFKNSFDLNMAALTQPTHINESTAMPPVGSDMDIMNWPTHVPGQHESLSKPSQHINTLLNPITGLDASGKANKDNATTFGQHFDIMKAGVFSEIKEAPKSEARQQQEIKYRQILAQIKDYEQQENKQRRVSDAAVIITDDMRTTQQHLMRAEIANQVAPSIDVRRKIESAPTKKTLWSILKELGDITLSAVKAYEQRQQDKATPKPGKDKTNTFSGEQTGGDAHSKRMVG